MMLSARSRRSTLYLVVLAALVAATLVLPGAADAAPRGDAAAVAAYWTPERMQQAIPRDLVIDEQGQGYLRLPNGRLQPYGAPATPAAKPDNPGGGGGGGGGSTDTTAPVISGLDPAAGATIPSSYTFSATVVDEGSGVKSVTFVINGAQYAGTRGTGDVWTTTVTGLTSGTWYVVAKDNAKKGGNTATSATRSFTVESGVGGGGDPTVTNAPWTAGGAVQTAAGRVYFEMPAYGPFWSGYVCSGTVATDGVSGRSIIITAAHCVYDDANKVFARNVLFIPNQAGTSGSGTDTNCNNDPLGCWAPSHGVVHDGWASRSWPNNIPWDYAYYVVPDSGAHAGSGGGSNLVLDGTTGSLPVQFSPVASIGAYTHALGYSYSEDPKFMFCAENLATDASSYNALWLGSCGLSGGASGGPWVQPMDTGTGSGPIVSVNSFGYSNQPGMGGPHLAGTSAQCLFNDAKTVASNTVSNC
jgi:hypothetical protein